MEVIVEGPDEWGNAAYETLLNRVLVDLGITTSVEKVKMIIEPGGPLFLVSLVTRKAAGTRKLTEVTRLEEKSNGTRITITDESYAPRILSALWRVYGRDRIDQLSRLEIMAEGLSKDELGELVLDPGEELREKVLDALWRVLPEGFKVRYRLVDEEVLTIASTEHSMKDEWKEKARKVHEGMEAG